MRLLLGLFFVLLQLTALAAPGAVVPIGGALRADNHEVWGRVVQLAGGPGSRFAVLAMASGDPAKAAAQTIAALQRHGAMAEPVRDEADIALVQRASGVFLAGGAQERLLQALMPGGRPTPLLQAVRAVLQRGGVVAGTSAGAAVLSEHVFIDLPDVLAAMKRPLREGVEVGRGFALLPATLAVDQHFLKRGRVGRLLPLMLARGLPLGLGVEEDSAAVVRGDEVEVIGARGALFIDLSEARTDPALGAFNVQGARLSYLDRGDRLDLRSRAITPSAVKLAGTLIDPHAATHRGYFNGPQFHADILGDFSIVNAMNRLVDSSQRLAIGLAFDATPAADDPAPDLGFEWRLRIGPRSRAWAGASGDTATVAEVLLDVLPVRIARPLYTPWTTR